MGIDDQTRAPDGLRAIARSAIEAGRWQEAQAALTQLCDAKAADAQDWFLLGAVNGQLGDFEAAVRCCRTSLQLRPGDPDTHYNLAQACLHRGDPSAAAANFREVLRRRPDHFDALNNLGYTLQRLGQYGEAAECHERALGLRPRHTDALINLGICLHGLGKPDSALEAYQAALRTAPDSAKAWYHLGLVLHARERYTDACAAYHRAATLQPGDMAAHANLGTLLLSLGRHTEADRCLRAALTANPDVPEATKPRQALLFALNSYEPDPARIAREHRTWGQWIQRLHPPQLAHANERDPNRTLRVGYISPDFRIHSVAFFFAPLLERHDPAQVHSVCYANVERPDRMTRSLRERAGAWRDIRGIGDARVAELVREDRIDLLVDLAGHTSFNRLGVFARKPAPVQIAWLGYPNTTGLGTIDYRFTDAICDPPGVTDHLHTEVLVRLPQGFLCYQAPLNAPSLRPPPSETCGHVTFGVFNNLSKVTSEAIACWARILRRVPGSRLIMKSKPLANPDARKRVTEAFEAAGIDPARVEMLCWIAGIESHLEQYNRIDIALDTFPYNGTTTTCEALWMGVPVVTLTGAAHAGRVGTSLLNTLEMTDWAAPDIDAYVEVAVQRARDPGALRTLRAGLRGRMLRSPLCDEGGFARQIEGIYRNLWHQWCQNGAGGP